MKLGYKEIDAIRWIMEEHNADLGVCEVEPFRDNADVGWLLVTIHRTLRGTSRTLPVEFRVSPLGHVYKRKGDWPNAEWDPVAIREGSGPTTATMTAKYGS